MLRPAESDLPQGDRFCSLPPTRPWHDACGSIIAVEHRQADIADLNIQHHPSAICRMPSIRTSPSYFDQDGLSRCPAYNPGRQPGKTANFT